ncbi:hypothetical protein D2V93_06720 [Flagellimonas taeanensis]|nr:hypothetical protein D2V93_06720 [Allomuricauda taeanensis]
MSFSFSQVGTNLGICILMGHSARIMGFLRFSIGLQRSNSTKYHQTLCAEKNTHLGTNLGSFSKNLFEFCP